MPSHNQNTVDTPEGGDGRLGVGAGLSRSNTNSLKKSFPGSPIHSGQMTRESVESGFQADVLDGEVVNGYCFSSFNRDYAGAPTIAEVAFGPGGLPGGPHVPNPASPGAGSANPSNMPAPPDDWEQGKTSRPPFVGEGSALEPSSSSTAIAGQRVKNLFMGRSYVT